MLKKIRQFFKEYKQLGLVIITVILGAALELTKHHKAAHIVLGGAALLNVLPLAWGMIEDLRSGKYGIDILAITAIVASVLLHEYWAATIIVLMLTGGESLEDYAERRAKKELSALLAGKPKKAHVIRKGKTIDVKASEIRVGDRVIILPGEVVPVDGEVIEGTSSFDESSLTGESMLVDKEPGDQLLSGSINSNGAVTIKATQTADDSQYQQIIKLVKAAANSEAPFVRLADKYSIPFTALSFIIAGAAWFVTGSALRFLEVIVVATPCPLLLGAPIALISGMSRAAKNGVIVKTGSALERLAQVETIAFDKTGTLTKGSPVVASVSTFKGFDQTDVLKYAAALEQSSNHILARAIVGEAAAKKIHFNAAKQVKETPGRGLVGRLQGKTIVVGKASFMDESGITVPTSAQKKNNGETLSYVGIDGVLAGVITLSDEVRPEAKHMLRILKKYRVKHTLMVTGDNEATAKVVAKRLGIETVLADCLPGDKIHAIERVEHKPVAFVGDGVNDAPVLTAADVGIALGARGSTAASESADVVILQDDVNKVATSVAVAKHTFSIAKQSILMGILISIGLMGVFATGRFKPVQGAVIQEFVDIAVILSALRAHSPSRKI